MYSKIQSPVPVLIGHGDGCQTFYACGRLDGCSAYTLYIRSEGNSLNDFQKGFATLSDLSRPRHIFPCTHAHYTILRINRCSIRACVYSNISYAAA